MTDQPEKKRLQVEMEKDLLEAFQRAARDEERTAAQLVREWVKDYMADEKRRQGDMLKGGK